MTTLLKKALAEKAVRKTALLVVFIIGVFLISGCDASTGCSKEAKICPDGSSVSRNPDNNCEFDPCPGTDETGFIECPEDIGEFCVQVYDPVCGDDGNTYSNDCVACQKVNKYKAGEC